MHWDCNICASLLSKVMENKHSLINWFIHLLKKSRKDENIFLSVYLNFKKILKLKRPAHQLHSTRPRRLTLFEVVNVTTYIISCDTTPIDMKMLVFFLRKRVQTAAETIIVDRKNEKVLALLYLASRPLRNSANSSLHCANCRVRSRTDDKDEVLEGKFVTWTFLLPPKRQLSVVLNFFFPLIKCFWLLLSLLKRG